MHKINHLFIGGGVSKDRFSRCRGGFHPTVNPTARKAAAARGSREGDGASAGGRGGRDPPPRSSAPTGPPRKSASSLKTVNLTPRPKASLVPKANSPAAPSWPHRTPQNVRCELPRLWLGGMDERQRVPRRRVPRSILRHPHDIPGSGRPTGSARASKGTALRSRQP